MCQFVTKKVLFHMHKHAVTRPANQVSPQANNKKKKQKRNLVFLSLLSPQFDLNQD